MVKEKFLRIDNEETLVKIYYLLLAFNYYPSFYTNNQGKYYTNIFPDPTNEKSSLNKALKLEETFISKDLLTLIREQDIPIRKYQSYSPILLDEEDTLPDVLYHYTNNAGLIGILESKTFWASQISFLNDKTEFIYAIEIAKECIEESSLNLELEVRDFLNAAIEIEIEAYLFINHTFIVSFSEKGDLLSQWRGYGNDGHGYSIGFKPFMIDLSDVSKDRDFCIYKVVYERDKQKNNLKSHLKILIEKIINQNFKTKEDIRQFLREDYETEFNLFLSDFILEMIRIKNPAFYEEAEWRLVSTCEAQFSKHKSKDINLRAGKNGQIIPYKAISYKHNIGGLHLDTFGISKIIIGPQNEIRQAKLSLEILIEKEISDFTAAVTIQTSKAAAYRT